MARRLLNWPRDLRWVSREPLAGPRSVGAGSTESLTGYLQTFSSAFGLWRWSFSFPPMKGREFRRYRGLVTALHGGANAVRVPFCDPDGIRTAEMGVQATLLQRRNGVPWANGQTWSNGQNWQFSRPTAYAFAAAKGATTITLGSEWWGYKLGVGDMIGFGPSHFGLYMVTGTDRTRGVYRVWPPLRKQVNAGDYATLEPTMAMRLESENSANAGRSAAQADGLTMTLIEVEDADVRRFYT